MASGTIKAVVHKSDIADNLTTNDGTKVLSAAQGYALNTGLDKLLHPISNISDCNNMTETGLYYVTNTQTNRPANYCIIHTLNMSSGAIAQYAFAVTTGKYYYRTYAANWSNWYCVNDQISKFSSSVPETISDFNSAKEPGYYRANTSTSNAPSSGYWAVSVIPFSAGDLAQIAIEVNNRKMCFRTLHDTSTWTSWYGINDNKSSMVDTANGVWRSGNVCFITCIASTWYNTAAWGGIRKGSTSASEWALPVGYRPVANVEIMETLNGKRIVIDKTTGAVQCATDISGGANLRFSGSWITNDPMPT